MDDYINFIYGDIDDEEFDDMYYTINPILEKESREFWDGLLNFFDFSEITASTLFSNEIVSPRNITKKNIYLQNEENYQRLKNNIQQVNLEYITGDIFSLAKKLDTKYDFINLSSIIYYNDLNRYKEMLETLPLMDNGEALTYLYKIKPFSQKQDFFPNCDFHSFDNDSGVIIYKKRVNN